MDEPFEFELLLEFDEAFDVVISRSGCGANGPGAAAAMVETVIDFLFTVHPHSGDCPDPDGRLSCGIIAETPAETAARERVALTVMEG